MYEMFRLTRPYENIDGMEKCVGKTSLYLTSEVKESRSKVG